MTTKRKVARRPVAAQVISLEAYRRARGMTASAPLDRDDAMAVYCRWLALAGAVWAFWW